MLSNKAITSPLHSKGMTDKSEIPRLSRQWMIFLRLARSQEGITVKTLAHDLNVCRKTIRRDLEALQKAEVPIIDRTHAHGEKVFCIEPLFQETGLTLTFDEATAFYMSWRFFQPLSGTFFWEAANDVFLKISSRLSDKTKTYADQLMNAFYMTTFGSGDYIASGHHAEALTTGLEDERAVHIRYQSLQASKIRAYEIEPYGLIFHEFSLYVVGWSCRANEIRHWKVDRIADAELTARRFKKPIDFDLETHMTDSFGVFQGGELIELVVRFTSDAARFVPESRWCERQTFEEQADGSILGRFEVKHSREVVRWILGLGANAEVLSPEQVRDEISEEIEKIRVKYSGST